MESRQKREERECVCVMIKYPQGLIVDLPLFQLKVAPMCVFFTQALKDALSLSLGGRLALKWALVKALGMIYMLMCKLYHFSFST